MDLNKKNYYSNEELTGSICQSANSKHFKNAKQRLWQKLKEEWSPESDPTALLSWKLCPFLF